MDRRHFLRTTGAAATTFALCGAAANAGRKGPNLLILHTDEHNFRTLGCYRETLPPEQALMWGKTAIVETPNIDWLAHNGALCEKFYATTPVCTPSRAAFVTGRYPHNTPASTNDIPLADNVVTFAEILRREGYATGYAGKWHLDGSGKPQWGPERKFGFADNRFMFNRGHWKQFEETAKGPEVKARDAKGNATYGVDGADAKSFATDWLADKTIEYINAHKDEPFCYMVSFPDPHGPNTVRPPYDTMYANLKFEKPRTFDAPEASVPRWGAKSKQSFNGEYLIQYFGMVKCIDDNVGKILEAVRAAGLIDNTIVVFCSDHGDMCGEHARDNKGVPFETSAKVPFILYYPAQVKAGTRIPQALSCVDFLPTVLAMMGVRTAGQEEGRDASALFTSKPPADWDDIVFIRSTSRLGVAGTWLAAVTPRFKLVFSQGDTPWLLDLERDPDELTNCFGNPEYRDIARALGKRLAEYCQKYKDPTGEHPRIKADLAWMIGGTGEYKPPPVAAAPAEGAAPAKAGKWVKGQKASKGKKAAGQTETPGAEDEE